MDWTDFFPQNEGHGAETVVDLPDGSRLLGLHIHGVEGYPMLGVKVDMFGRPISVAREEAVFYVETQVPAQSNPRRQVDSDFRKGAVGE